MFQVDEPVLTVECSSLASIDILKINIAACDSVLLEASQANQHGLKTFVSDQTELFLQGLSNSFCCVFVVFLWRNMAL